MEKKQSFTCALSSTLCGQKEKNKVMFTKPKRKKNIKLYLDRSAK
jgi:hypothetical protein